MKKKKTKNERNEPPREKFFIWKITNEHDWYVSICRIVGNVIRAHANWMKVFRRQPKLQTRTTISFEDGVQTLAAGTRHRLVGILMKFWACVCAYWMKKNRLAWNRRRCQSLPINISRFRFWCEWTCATLEAKRLAHIFLCKHEFAYIIYNLMSPLYVSLFHM